MDAGTVSELILHYRYWILIPLTFIEGPIVAFVAGTFASLDYFNIYALAILFLVRDVGMDGVYYAIGYYGGRTKFAEKMMKKIGVNEDHLDNVRIIWEEKPFRTMFLGKLSYGIAHAFIVIAGTIKMPLKMFFKYGIMVTLIQYGGLLALGYFYGTSFSGNATKIIQNIQYVIAGATFLISGYYILSWYIKKKFIKEDKKA